MSGAMSNILGLKVRKTQESQRRSGTRLMTQGAKARKAARCRKEKRRDENAEAVAEALVITCCSACEGTGKLLDSVCPLCDGEPLEVEAGKVFDMTEGSPALLRSILRKQHRRRLQGRVTENLLQAAG